MAASVTVVVVYIALTRSHALAGDELEYHRQGVFFTEGHWWWSTTPFGIAHPSAWKAPGYPAWVGFWYALLGSSPLRLAFAQSLLAPITVLLTWLLARRLFGARVAIASAFVVALFPLAWEYYGLLFSEALAIPLTIGVLALVLGREPTIRLAAAAGILVGASLLVRPTSFFLIAALAGAWVVTGGWRRGVALTAVAIGVAILVVLPWTVRNLATEDVGFVPISVQDGAAYGTFNPTSANDPKNPYAWRATPPEIEEVLDTDQPISDSKFRSELQSAAFDYIGDHPFSVAEAFFYNGVTRLWDLRPPSDSVDEVAFQGRSEAVRIAGLAAYYLLLPLAVAGLWRARRRREIIVPFLAMAAVASLAFTVIGGTRYRAPLEPAIVILAASLLAGRRGAAAPTPAPSASGATSPPAPRPAPEPAPPPR